MSQIAAALSFWRGICDHDIRAAAAIQFPNQRAADKSAASGNQHPESLPSVFLFADHYIELSAALLYSSGLFLGAW
jgi:hypothetical protein